MYTVRNLACTNPFSPAYVVLKTGDDIDYDICVSVKELCMMRLASYNTLSPIYIITISLNWVMMCEGVVKYTSWYAQSPSDMHACQNAILKTSDDLDYDMRPCVSERDFAR